MDDQPKTDNETKFYAYASQMLFKQQQTLEAISAKLTWVAIAAGLAIIGGVINVFLSLIR